ncbi:MAG: hypothetical protein IOC92_15470 [Rhodobacter sp.]|nr:hypothetical protein [Rhodobacter sp.]MCA3468625.1 hypothetical protein [Rhodobacter sp.]MCA3473859.1 hypothetical protein [Rhodobacter sp.]MCA3478464.1 hypothetical protein [Rhodobacter sp.]MCA3485298.1 hypothetical protein [Rhodobacter sp.]
MAEFLRRVVETHKTQRATEHSYRSALKALFDALRPAEITAALLHKSPEGIHLVNPVW